MNLKCACNFVYLLQQLLNVKPPFLILVECVSNEYSMLCKHRSLFYCHGMLQQIYFPHFVIRLFHLYDMILIHNKFTYSKLYAAIAKPVIGVIVYWSLFMFYWKQYMLGFFSCMYESKSLEMDEWKCIKEPIDCIYMYIYITKIITKLFNKCAFPNLMSSSLQLQFYM